MNRNGNLAVAYDTLHEQKKKKTNKRKIVVTTNTAVRHKGRTLNACLIGLIAVLMAAALFGRVEISELYTQRAELETKLERIQDETAGLEAEFTQKTGMTKVEEYAEDKLGLNKLDKSQIEYVEVKSPEKAEVINSDDSNIFVKIKRWFSSALEYIGL